MPHVATWGYLHAGSTWVKAGSVDVTRRFRDDLSLAATRHDLFLHHLHCAITGVLMERQENSLSARGCGTRDRSSKLDNRTSCFWLQGGKLECAHRAQRGV